MKVSFDGQQVNVDDGRLVVTEARGGYFVRAEGFATIEANGARERTYPEFDEHYYYNGNNGLRLNDSVERALQNVEDMILRAGVEAGSWDTIWDAAEAIIKDPDTNGRNSVYRLAGGVIKGMTDGDYVGVPFAWLFLGVVNGNIVSDAHAETTHMQNVGRILQGLGG